MVTISGLCSHTQKSSETCVYALAATREMLYQCDKRLLQSADTLDVHQVGNGVHGCVQVGGMVRNRPVFIDARVKINDAYCRGVLLTQKLLPVMHEIGSEFFIFQQSNFPAHRARRTINLLKRDTCVHFTGPFATEQHRYEPD